MTLAEQIAAASAKATEGGTKQLSERLLAFQEMGSLLLELWFAGKLLVIEDEQEAVRRMARATCNSIVQQDDEGFEVQDDWGGTIAYLDQGEVDFIQVATAALAALKGEG